MHYSCGTNQTLSSPNHQFTNHFCNNYILKEAKRRRQNESSKRGNSTLSLKQVPPSTKVTAVVTAELNAPCELGGCSWGRCTNPAGEFRQSVSWRTGQGQRRSNLFQSRRTVTSSINNHIEAFEEQSFDLPMKIYLFVISRKNRFGLTKFKRCWK